MLKRIASWKYGIPVLIILGGCVYVSHQDQRTRDQYEQKCNQLNASTVPPSAHQEDCDKGAENAARHLPRWFRIFSWPEGITTWAILLTLFAIAEQTSQTRRSADISERVLVSTFRPRVEVRSVNLRVIDAAETSDKKCAFELTIVNVGGTDAVVDPFEVTLEWVSGELPGSLILKKQIQKFSLAAGERKMFPIEVHDIAKFMVSYYMIENVIRSGKDQTAFPVCRGTIVYFDQNNAERRTGFARGWNIKGACSIANKDPEFEYQD
jgi:hypothetical protein